MTNILVEHYQQQHKHRLAETQLLIGIFVCVCVCVRDFVGLSQGKEGYCQGGRVLPSGTRVITREHREDKKC